MQVTVKCFFGICRWQIFSPSLGVTYTHHHDETVVVALLSRAQLFVTPWTTAYQASCPSLSPRICSNSRPWRQWCHPNIYSLLPPSCFAFNLSQQQGLFQWVSSSYQVVKVIKFQHSVQFSRSVVSNSLRPHESQHARPPYPSPTPGVYPNSCPSSQPSHPLSYPSPPALNLSQPQGLFKWVSSSHQVAKVLEFQVKHQSYQWTPRTDLL